MAVLILGVIEAPDWGWGSAATVSTMAAGAALLVLFVLFELRTDHPMLDVGLFRNPRFTAASGSVAISFFALQGFIFLVTQYFQFIKTFSPLGTGVRLLPVAGAVAVASVVGTKLAVRVGNKVIVASGLALFAAALLWSSTVSASTSYPIIIVAQMLILGTGMGLTSAPATEAIMGAVPAAKAGVGSAVNDATRLFGGTLGVAVIGSIAASLYSNRLASTAPAHLPAQAASAAKASVGAAFIASHILSKAGLTQAGQALANSASGAFLHSLAGGCLWPAVSPWPARSWRRCSCPLDRAGDVGTAAIGSRCRFAGSCAARSHRSVGGQAKMARTMRDARRRDEHAHRQPVFDWPVPAQHRASPHRHGQRPEPPGTRGPRDARGLPHAGPDRH